MNYVSFPIHGNHDSVYLGALENLDAVRRHYPDFSPVLWIPEAKRNWQRHFDARGATCVILPEVTRCTMFRALTLPNADRVLFRFPENLITPREAAAVRVWIQSGKGWHAMRDHVFHFAHCPAPACTIGAFRGDGEFLPADVLESALNGPEASRNRPDSADLFAKRFLWARMSADGLFHNGVAGSLPGEPWPAHSPCEGYVGQRIFL